MKWSRRRRPADSPGAAEENAAPVAVRSGTADPALFHHAVPAVPTLLVPRFYTPLQYHRQVLWLKVRGQALRIHLPGLPRCPA